MINVLIGLIGVVVFLSTCYGLGRLLNIVDPGVVDGSGVEEYILAGLVTLILILAAIGFLWIVGHTIRLIFTGGL